MLWVVIGLVALLAFAHVGLKASKLWPAPEAEPEPVGEAEQWEVIWRDPTIRIQLRSWWQRLCEHYSVYEVTINGQLYRSSPHFYRQAHKYPSGEIADDETKDQFFKIVYRELEARNTAKQAADMRKDWGVS